MAELINKGATMAQFPITAIKTRGYNMKYLVILAALVLPIQSANAWDGYDSDSGTSVEIGKGNLVRPGQDIEVYDSQDGEYKDVTVESVNDGYGAVDVEVYDNDSGEYKTYRMDKD